MENNTSHTHNFSDLRTDAKLSEGNCKFENVVKVLKWDC